MRRAALLLLGALAAPAAADERAIAPGEILGPDDHAHLFAEICFSADPPAALAASPHFEAERGNRFSTPDGLAFYELTDSSCRLGLAPGAGDFGLALEDAVIDHMAEIAPGAEARTLAAGLEWIWQEGGAEHRAEYLAAEDAYILTHTTTR